jgi:hypothetical protein
MSRWLAIAIATVVIAAAAVIAYAALFEGL